MPHDYHAAIAAAVAGAEGSHRLLLTSIVDVARAIFAARAASVFLLDEEHEELVFEAVSGEGSGQLVGTRFPAATGIAGWCLVTRQPLLLDDVRRDPRFGAQAAQSTGYVPQAIMSVPLLHQERALGVLQVLDRSADAAGGLHAIELLGMFANQAGIALDLLGRARRAADALRGDDRLAAVAALARTLDDATDQRAADDLIDAITRVLTGARPLEGF